MKLHERRDYLDWVENQHRDRTPWPDRLLIAALPAGLVATLLAVRWILEVTT